MNTLLRRLAIVILCLALANLPCVSGGADNQRKGKALIVPDDAILKIAQDANQLIEKPLADSKPCTNGLRPNALLIAMADPATQLPNNAAPSNRKNSSKDVHLSKPRKTSEAVKSAIRKSLRLLEKASAGAVQHRRCFTCHNQALPVLAFVEARKRGFTIDEDNLKLQIKQTVEYASPRKSAIALGYALWALEAGGWKSDEATTVLTEFLLKTQQQASHWRGEPLDKSRQIRPPAAGSDFTTTYVALRGLTAFGAKEQKPRIEARTKTVRQWLLSATPGHTEDCVFRLRLLKYVDAGEGAVRKATAKLLRLQRTDGGWAQTSDMKSDAYATGSALVALIRAGDVRTDHLAVRRGVRYLIDTQQKDGSWHVKTRAKPVQPYFESGFPHGKDQFISIFASSWATLALLQVSTR